MRTTVDIEPSLLKRIRDEAYRRGIPFKDMLTSVLRRGLEERSEPARRFRTPTFAMGQARGGLDLTKARDIADAIDDEIAIDALRARR